MRNKRIKAAAALLAAMAMGGSLIGCSDGGGGGNSGDGGEVSLKILHNWNGSGAGDVEADLTPIAKAIQAKTGVKVKMDYTKGSEVEKVNQIFATQDLPDIYTGPAWGGELDGIVKAAREDQLVDLSGKLDAYPNLSRAIAKENVPPALYEKAIGAFGDQSYMLFQNQPLTDKDAMDWLYGFYVRKDIADQVGVDPQSVRTKDDLYAFLKKIKDADLKENGMPVFPLGGFSNGWAVGIGNTMFYGTEYMDQGGGTLEHVFFTKPYEDYTLYYRKLLAEGLLDPEAFTQTDPIAQEKIKQGRIAVLAAHLPAIIDASKDYVKAHPGSDYVPIGPLERAGAEPDRPVDLGIQGNNVTVITKACKNVDAALKLLEFLASEEGFKLVRYGIEGTHYDMVDGKPVAKAEFFDKFAADTTGKAKKNEGFATGFEDMTGQDRTNTLGGDIWADQERIAKMESARKILRPNGISVISAYNAADVMAKSPQWEELKPSMDKIGDVWKEAVFAKSDEAALDIIGALREQIKKTGYPEAIQYVNENLKGKEVVQLQMPN
ncbi:extracellular solute-binding protein [Paenibacillus sp. B01]|uniref:extracellular solute-binding protein n=1 Tax=Paenibacillus sp. B01 TaxID=2660554 RepID=UPI00129BF2CC|nr:extracellular solute-binding protein [Paenibacillus sp. B01]QGG56726.1 extracellular solute-binding protein [Paenibacillus sp. B01]